MAQIEKLNTYVYLEDNKATLTCCGCFTEFDDGRSGANTTGAITAAGVDIPEIICPECGGTKWNINIPYTLCFTKEP